MPSHQTLGRKTNINFSDWIGQELDGVGNEGRKLNRTCEKNFAPELRVLKRRGEGPSSMSQPFHLRNQEAQPVQEEERKQKRIWDVWGEPVSSQSFVFVGQSEIQSLYLGQCLCLHHAYRSFSLRLRSRSCDRCKRYFILIWIRFPHLRRCDNPLHLVPILPLSAFADVRALSTLEGAHAFLCR